MLGVTLCVTNPSAFPETLKTSYMMNNNQ
jgi:hypothetical protein